MCFAGFTSMINTSKLSLILLTLPVDKKYK